MSAWWKMMCDDGHGWETFVDGDGEPAEELLICSEDGLPAVTAMRLALSDRAVIQLFPAAWEREGTVRKGDEYFLEIRSTASPDRHYRSPSPLAWDDAIRYAAMFRGIPWDQAERRWSRIRPLRDG